MAGTDDIVRGLLVVIVVGIGTVLGWVLFVRTPDNLAQLLGVLLVVAVAVATARIGSNVAGSLLPAHNVAEVAVEGRSAVTAVAASPVHRWARRPTTSSNR